MGLNVQFGQTKAVAVQSRDMGWARPSAFHPNGLNVMFCDNHVRFISDTISYGIFQALCTPKGSSMTEATSGTLYNPLAHQGQRVDFDERSIQ
jgi:prepilin-type processing-associated H-X9-DG protein